MPAGTHTYNRSRQVSAPVQNRSRSAMTSSGPSRSAKLQTIPGNWVRSCQLERAACRSQWRQIGFLRKYSRDLAESKAYENKKHRLLTRAPPFRGATVRERSLWLRLVSQIGRSLRDNRILTRIFIPVGEPSAAHRCFAFFNFKLSAIGGQRSASPPAGPDWNSLLLAGDLVLQTKGLPASHRPAASFQLMESTCMQGG
jgi:hypothetical protein